MELHTKSDFTALARKILSPLLPLYSAGGARLHLGDTGVTYPARTIEMEAFSRPLWALGPLWAGGGRADDFLAIYQKGLAPPTITTSCLSRWPPWPVPFWKRRKTSGHP